MGQPQMARSQWLFQNTVDEECTKQMLQKEQRRLADERQKFEREKQEFLLKQQMEERRLAQQMQLFEMKWKILEAELQQLAADKQEVALEREKYKKAEREPQRTNHNVVRGEMFFSGVDSELGMKKRYKDLIKIFHPDNRDGDTFTLQIINREYDEMKKLFLV